MLNNICANTALFKCTKCMKQIWQILLPKKWIARSEIHIGPVFAIIYESAFHYWYSIIEYVCDEYLTDTYAFCFLCRAILAATLCWMLRNVCSAKLRRQKKQIHSVPINFLLVLTFVIHFRLIVQSRSLNKIHYQAKQLISNSCWCFYCFRGTAYQCKHGRNFEWIE